MVLYYVSTMNFFFKSMFSKFVILLHVEITLKLSKLTQREPVEHPVCGPFHSRNPTKYVCMLCSDLTDSTV